MSPHVLLSLLHLGSAPAFPFLTVQLLEGLGQQRNHLRDFTPITPASYLALARDHTCFEAELILLLPVVVVQSPHPHAFPC